MIGIQEIGSYIPSNRISNYDLKDKFEMDDNFIENKIGVQRVSRMLDGEDTSVMCVKAFNNLEQKIDIEKGEIECLILITQNPDSNIPHTSAVLHGLLDLPENCACFGVSLGCSGFVYGLSIIESFMQRNGMKKGLLFTSDPYSKIIDPEDKNTQILFGDGATVSLITDTPVYISGKYNFGTVGKEFKNLICTDNSLYMNGRGIFNFAARYVPKDIKQLLEKNELLIDDIDKFVFHQGSKYIIDTLIKRIGLEKEKVPFDIQDYGNTVSSSIPLIIEKEIKSNTNKMVAIGFGVGLSWASTILTKIN